MANEIFERIRVKCESLSRTPEVSTDALQAALRECVEVGFEIRESRLRAKLQEIADELANRIFATTDTFPNSIIRPPDQVEHVVAGAQRQSEKPVGLNAMLLGIPAALIVLIVLVSIWLFKTTSNSNITNQQITPESKPDGPAQHDLERRRQARRQSQESLAEFLNSLTDDQQERYAITNCLKFFRSCEMTGGPFAGTFRMNAEGDDVWVSPARANLACLAILAARRKYPDLVSVDDINSVLLWFSWFAENQDQKTGQIVGFHGSRKRGELKPNLGEIDLDAPALYLQALEKYFQVIQRPSQKLVLAARLSLRSILDRYPFTKGAKSKDDLYLMTGINDFGGLSAAANLFKRLGDVDMERQAIEAAKSLGQRLRQFLQPLDDSQKAFAVSFLGDRYQLSLAESVDIQANLIGLAWVKKDVPGLWTRLTTLHKPGDEIDPIAIAPYAPVEYWLAAASVVESKENVKQWKRRVVLAAAGFSQASAYIDRPAVAALTLVDGADWRTSSELGRPPNATEQ